MDFPPVEDQRIRAFDCQAAKDLGLRVQGMPVHWGNVGRPQYAAVGAQLVNVFTKSAAVSSYICREVAPATSAPPTPNWR